MKRLLVLLVALFIVAAACGSSNKSSGGSAANINTNATLVFGDNMTGSGSSQRLQPDLMTSVCDFFYGNQIFSTLVRLDIATGSAQPGLAESWKFVDARTITFTLRPNLTFQDGTKLDTAAVKAGLDRNRTAPSKLAATMAEFDSVTADTPTQFTIKMKTDSSAIVPLTLAGREGMIAAASSTDTKPVGAGAYKFVSQTIGSEMVLARFDGYWNAKNVKIANVRIVNTGTQGTTWVTAVQAGDVDVVGTNPGVNQPIENDPNVQIAHRPSAAYHKLNVNTSRGPWTNKTFRQAMNYAIDRAAIAQVLFRGQAETAWMPYPSFFVDQYNKSVAEKYPYDVNKAKQLIQQSGLATPINTVAMYPAGSTQFQQFAEIVQRQMAAVGVNVTLVPTTDGVREFLTDHKADFFTTLWPPRPDPSVTIQRQFGPNQLNNTGNYLNPAMDAAIAKTRSSTDPKIQKEGYQEADKIVVEDALEVPIAFPEVTYAHRTWVTGDFRMFESCQGLDLSTLAVTTAKK